MPSGSVVISLIRSWFLSRVSPRFRLAGDVCESLSSVDLAKAPASVPWIFSVVPWSPFCRSPLLYLLFLFLWLLWRESPSSHMETQPYEVTRPCDLSHLVSRAKPLLWVGGGEGKGPPLSCSQQLELGAALEMVRPAWTACVYWESGSRSPPCAHRHLEWRFRQPEQGTRGAGRVRDGAGVTSSLCSHQDLEDSGNKCSFTHSTPLRTSPEALNGGV